LSDPTGGGLGGLGGRGSGVSGTGGGGGGAAEPLGVGDLVDAIPSVDAYGAAVTKLWRALRSAAKTVADPAFPGRVAAFGGKVGARAEHHGRVARGRLDWLLGGGWWRDEEEEDDDGPTG